MCDKDGCDAPPRPESRFCAEHGPREGLTLQTYLADAKINCNKRRGITRAQSCRCAEFTLRQIFETSTDVESRKQAGIGLRAMKDRMGVVKW